MLEGEFNLEAPDDTPGLPFGGRRFVPWSELFLRQQTSGGPGGQHANRSATTVVLRWSPGTSTALNEAEKNWLMRRLASRIGADGALQLRSSDQRSARRNQETVLERLTVLITEGLARPKVRRPTRPTAASKKRRLDGKRLRSRRKDGRRRPDQDE